MNIVKENPRRKWWWLCRSWDNKYVIQDDCPVSRNCVGFVGHGWSSCAELIQDDRYKELRKIIWRVNWALEFNVVTGCVRHVLGPNELVVGNRGKTVKQIKELLKMKQREERNDPGTELS